MRRTPRELRYAALAGRTGDLHGTWTRVEAVAKPTGTVRKSYLAAYSEAIGAMLSVAVRGPIPEKRVTGAHAQMMAAILRALGMSEAGAYAFVKRHPTRFEDLVLTLHWHDEDD